MFIVKRCPGSRVVGIDPSQEMLRIGLSKVARAGLAGRISMLPGDVLNLQFPDKCFDGVITAFCIRNVTERRGALAEIYRVMRPGSRLVILELIEPDGIMKPLFSTLFQGGHAIGDGVDVFRSRVSLSQRFYG